MPFLEIYALETIARAEDLLKKEIIWQANFGIVQRFRIEFPEKFEHFAEEKS